ncbi:MAG: hypothetical protein WBG19_09635 [Thermoplasmata archaeon]
MSNRDFRLLAVEILATGGFRSVKKNNRSKHEKFRHPDGRTAIIGFKTRDRHLLNKILKHSGMEPRI